MAAERKHLTTVAAGSIARTARVRRVEPFLLPAMRRVNRMLNEVMSAFSGPLPEEAT